MPDSEKVKRGVKCHAVLHSCVGCPYDVNFPSCIDNLFQDVFELLELDERLEDDLK